MRIRRKRLATSMTLALALVSANSYAGDVEISLPAATDAFTIDQPAGTELMRVQGNGNVGIGTTSPSGKLDVQDSNGRLGLFNGSTFVSRNSSNTLVVRNSDTSSGNLGQIVLERGDGSGDDMALTTLYDNNNGVGSLGISSGSNMLMNIVKNGTVGIGTINPSDGTANGGQALKLDVEGAVGASTYCDENGENCQTILQLASGGSGGKFVDGTDPNNAVYTTGNVGIGTTDPTVKLHVVDNDTAYQTQFLIENKNAQIPNTYEYKGGYAWQKTAHNNWDGEPRFMMARSRGSIDAPTANQEGDYIGQIEFRAYDGGTLRRGASIRAQVDGTVAASNMPASLHFLTEAEGGSDPIERMVIKNNGNVGIGTTAPDETLHVNGSIKLATRIISDNEIYLNPNGSPSDGFKLIGEPTKSTLMGHRNELIIGTERENTASEDDVIFQYSDANKTFEWMRLDASTGNVGIGTSNPRGGLDIANDAAIPLVVERTNTNGGGFVWQDFMADGNHQWRINGDSSNGGGTANLKFSTIHDNGATVKPRLVLDPSGRIGINELTPTATLHVGATGGIRFDGLTVDATGGYLCHDSATGLVTHGASCAASDERLKKDITPVTNALEKITELQGVNYHWKDENRGTRMELGLVAQAVENIIPEVVDTASDDMGTKSIRYENLVALLIEGMKEQQAQIDAQQKIIERLEANIK